MNIKNYINEKVKQILNEKNDIIIEIPPKENMGDYSIQCASYRTDELKIPIQRINDEDELDEYKLKKRRDFEDQIRRNRYNIHLWIKYAEWEEHQTEYIRARSIFERSIEIDYKNPSLWLKYAEMEMKNKFVKNWTFYNLSAIISRLR